MWSIPSQRHNRNTKLNLILLLVLTLVFLSGCADNRYRGIKNFHTAKGTTIVCFGNSLTAGVGAPKGADYPSLLAQRLPLPVINAGIAGDTTTSALTRVESDVLTKEPKVVIIELGANDFLNSAGAKEVVDKAFQNLALIIDRIQNHGAVVVLASVGINYDIEKRYEKLAKEKGAVFVPDIMEGILENPKLMSDSLHPNAEGYRIIAERILEILVPLLKEME